MSDSHDKLETNVIHTGDVYDVLPTLPESSVHMCMTSPPYFGLRDYGEEDQIGLEESLDEYIQNLVRVGDELKRVLRDDGSWWLNLGDTYSGGSIVRSDSEWTEPGDEGYEDAHTATTDSNGRRSMSPLGRKNKMLVPHRVAIALQESGWVVRNDVTWVKPNPMPQNVTDRLNTTTEQIFHLTPKPDYYYDLDAIREPYSDSMERRKEYQSKHGGHENDGWGGGSHHQGGGLLDDSQTYGDTMNPEGKIPGDVFEVTTKPFPGAHFAVYPPELCEKPIKATCPPGGVVLDPFAGAGTTLLKAKELNRDFVGIELSAEYADIARSRLEMDLDDPSRFRDEEEAGLDDFA